MRHASDGRRAANLLGTLALATADRLRASSDTATGCTSSDTAALVLLANNLDGHSQDALGQALGLTQSASVRLVDRLAEAGLAERRPGPDGRTRAIVLTAAGTRAARRAVRARGTSMESVLAPLDEAEQRQLAHLMEKLLTGLTGGRKEALHLCRLCDPDACGHWDGRCPVTLAAAAAEAG